MPVDEVTLRYEGPPALVGLLVSALEDEGYEVDWQPPMERRGAEEIAVGVLIGVVSNAGWDGLKLAVSRLRERFPMTKVEVERGPDDLLPRR